MKMSSVLRIVAVAAVGSAALCWSFISAQDQIPSTQPVPAVQPAGKVDPRAAAELEQIRAAYGKLQSLDLAGKLSAQFDVAGQKRNQETDFTASFAAPNRFKHQSKEDVLVGSTGEKLYLYSPEENAYLSIDAPQGNAGADALPAPFGQLLQSQNPSLAMALSGDAVKGLSGADVERLADVELDQRSYLALKVSGSAGGNMMMLIDPQTHLLRRVNIDMKPTLEARGALDVKQAELVVDYKTSTPGAVIEKEQFAWTPPQGAKDAAAQNEADADALVGQPAPAFTLKNLEGKEVALADQKGSVVILDFWATWCGPCVESMPHLDKLYQEKKGDGLKVLAVNLREDKEQIQAFMKQHKLSMPALLDSDAKTAELYKVEGIPQTVVINKDGTVRKVFVGFGPGSEEALRKEVEDAMKVK